MSAASFIEHMRKRQESLYSTTVVVGRGALRTVFDETTARYAVTSPMTTYDGPALVRFEPPQLVDVGEATEQVTHYTVKLPPDTDVALGDTISVTASSFDAGLVGKRLRVLEVRFDEWQIARVCKAAAEGERPL